MQETRRSSVGLFGASGDGRAGRDVPAGRPAAHDHPPRVHAEVLAVGPQPADGAAGVLGALVGGDAVVLADPVVRQADHDAESGEVLGHPGAGEDVGAGPAAAGEEDQRRQPVRRRPARRRGDVHPQFPLRRLLVGELLVAPLLAFGRKAGEIGRHVEAARGTLPGFGWGRRVECPRWGKARGQRPIRSGCAGRRVARVTSFRRSGIHSREDQGRDAVRLDGQGTHGLFPGKCLHVFAGRGEGVAGNRFDVHARTGRNRLTVNRDPADRDGRPAVEDAEILLAVRPRAARTLTTSIVPFFLMPVTEALRSFLSPL